ncbi:MAG: nuclear transport factor 2 family protein [Bacteroidales bacterium]|nr:nuclear transport factor 2 family protein [Bacteroidales bacterium]
MKKFILFLVFGVVSATLLRAQSDEMLIKKVIDESYVIGIHNDGDIEQIERGFHPTFVLLGLGKDRSSVTQLPIATWIENISKSKAAGKKPTVETTCKYLFVDVTGDSAVAKIELHREGKLIFTDYLALYKFGEGWRIVSKIYYRHN